MSLTEYFNDLGNGKINTHKEALKYYSVRFTSFLNSYPKDCQLPACTLSQYGFYYDESSKKIRCIECAFQFENLYTESLGEILSLHYKHNNTCDQAKMSIAMSAQQSIENVEFKRALSMDYISQTNLDNDSLEIPTSSPPKNESNLSKKLKHQNSLTKTIPTQQQKNQNQLKSHFQIEENRLKSFENIKMLFDPRKLAAQGIFKVTNDPTNSSSGSFNKKNDHRDNEEQLTHIESLSRSVPALMHIKCAFCPYECLIFRNSLLNTLYKSPFDEHKEKSFSTCIIFQEEFLAINKIRNNKKFDMVSDSRTNIDDSNTMKNLNYMTINNKALDWLQILYDIESNIEISSLPISAYDMLIYKNDVNLQDIIELKKLPKVVNTLVNLHKKEEIISNYNNDCSSNSESIMYSPVVNSTKDQNQKASTTSDFNRIQSVLNLSDNVISDKAYHPAYTLLQARIDSYKEWPATLSQQPLDLAKAGFYYFGIKDMVKCFFCNGGLKNWDHNDDPIEDHVRWFPKCQFIKQLKGAEYVEKIREKYKNMDSGFNSEYGNASSFNHLKDSTSIHNNPVGTSINSMNRHGVNNSNVRPKRPVSPRTLNSRLDTHIVRKITDANIVTRESIKMSIEKKLSSSSTNTNLNANINRSNQATTIYSDDFKSPFEMAEMAYNFDKNKQDSIELFKSISDLMLCFLPDKITSDCLKEIFQIKFGIYPTSVRIIKEQHSLENRLFGFVSLKREDHSLIDNIITDLDRKPFPGFPVTSNSYLLVFKTNWIELEEKLKPLLDKSAPVSTSLEENQIEKILPNQRNENESNSPITSSSNTVLNQKNIQLAKSENSEISKEDQLKEENERLKNERLCVICLTKDKDVLFLPCAHLAACLECSLSLKTCPICRSKIQASVRTFT